MPRYSQFVLSEKVYPHVFVFQKSYGLSYQINRFLPLVALVRLVFVVLPLNPLEHLILRRQTHYPRNLYRMHKDHRLSPKQLALLQ